MNKRWYTKQENRFSIRKYSVGAASVLLATLSFMSSQIAVADEIQSTPPSEENPVLVSPPIVTREVVETISETTSTSVTTSSVGTQTEATMTKVPTVPVPEIPKQGTYTFTEKTGIKNEPAIASPDQFYYDKGQKVIYDKVMTADDYQWISYVSFSGTRRYAPINKLTKTEPTTTLVTDKPVETPATNQTQTAETSLKLSPQGSYAFTERVGVKREAKMTSPDVAFYDKGMKVNYDKVVTADNHQWLSYISFSGGRSYIPVAKVAPVSIPTVHKPAETATPVSELPKAGTYRFTQDMPIRNQPKMSSPAEYYYQKGEKVNYDSTLVADDHNWISYVSYNGTRRYIAISKVATPVTPVVQTPAISQTETAEASLKLAPQGSYTFTERAGVKREAKLSSPDVAFYDKGMKVNYDKVITADNHQWLSYISFSGGRSYIPVAKVAPVTTPTVNKPVESPKPDKPTVTPAISQTETAEASLKLAPQGTYTFTERVGIKREAKMTSPDVAFYDKDMKVNYDKVITADNHQWLSYISFSGGRYYIPVAKVAPVTTPTVQKTVESPKPDKPTVTPVTSQTETAEASLKLAPQGTYTFTERVGVKREAKMTSPDVAFYDKGMKVNYDKIITADNHQWLSYISFSGGRSYIPVAKVAPVTTPTVHKPVESPKPEKPAVTPATTQTETAEAFLKLAPQGSYTFTERVGVKREAKMTSPDVAFYDKGMKVNYDKIITADNHQWLSYISFSGSRSYIPVAKLIDKADKPAVSNLSTETQANQAKLTFNGKYYSVDGKYGPVIIVNKQHGLASTYNPGENPTARNAYQNLRNDMIRQGFNVGKAYSGFRSYETQQSLYLNYVQRDGQAAADRYSARPGHSEHQTGLAFDLTDASGALLTNSRAEQWLKDNAHKYGFVVRYLPGKEAVTGYMSEPWHLRYVGNEAKDIYQSGLTLEEYYGIPGGDYQKKQTVQANQANRCATNVAAQPLPAKGTYRFTKGAVVRNAAKSTSPALYTFAAGESINYDRVVKEDGKTWLSYIAYSGNRRYVQIA
ncbi:LD-carboxypeptidase LdcB/DacB [Streptococcus suis]|uniref:LD-carboxypeptidase LdcB/DacB n=1 Tax=Streptococcus suis TaxID=1307 RepID=UPI0014782A27